MFLRVSLAGNSGLHLREISPFPSLGEFSWEAVRAALKTPPLGSLRRGYLPHSFWLTVTE
jgi:hypothetical protein